MPAKPAGPRLETVAETKLLMEGITNTNYKGLDRLLNKSRPTRRRGRLPAARPC